MSTFTRLQLKRSKKGNLWTTVGDKTVSVFRHPDGYWRWSIADGNGPRYSKKRYTLEARAVRALERELKI